MNISGEIQAIGVRNGYKVRSVKSMSKIEEGSGLRLAQFSILKCYFKKLVLLWHNNGHHR